MGDDYKNVKVRRPLHQRLRAVAVARDERLAATTDRLLEPAIAKEEAAIARERAKKGVN